MNTENAMYSRSGKNREKGIEQGTANGSDETYRKVTTRVSALSAAGNVVLTALKLAAGVFGHSGAMISDAVHSSTDVLGSLIVIMGVRISVKEADKNHPYGHERFECIASLLLSFLLLLAAFEIVKAAGSRIMAGTVTTVPGMIALAAAVISILVKEGMYHYTLHYASAFRSESLKAEAWHHRSDALSSIGSLAGIIGARMGFPILDPLAAVFISFFILKAAWEIFIGAVDQLTDHSCDPLLEEEIRACISGCEGVGGIDLLRTRAFGRKIYLDVEVRMDRTLTLEKAHAYAERVHDKIEDSFPEIKHVMVHVNPDCKY